MVAKAALILGREALIARASSRVLQDLQNGVLARYAHAPSRGLVDQKRGDVEFDCLIAPAGVALLMRKLPQLIAELLRVLAITAVFLLASAGVAAVLLAVLAAIMGLIHACSKRMAYGNGTGRIVASAEQLGLVNELLDGQRQIAVYGVTGHWLARFQGVTRRYTGLLARYLVWLALPKAVVELAIVLSMLGLIGAMRLVAPGRLIASLPLLGLFAVGLFQLLPALSAVGRLRMELEEARPEAERLRRALQGQPVEAWPGSRRYEGLREHVVLNAVSFQYPGRTPLLSGVTCSLPKGTVTALVGSSGVGKTTVISLLLGLLEPTGGSILVDGVPLRDYALGTWRARLGYVSQDAFMVHASIEENIRFGRPAYSRADVVKAATIAHAHPFIAELPQGYDTVIGERGAKLSGGQQQRLAIARAILGDPELLILDEATSALDQASERAVRDAVTEACRDRTVLMVTHGMAMAMEADQIVVLNGGRVEQIRAKASGRLPATAAALLATSYGAPER
jgi:ABC-type multidrug transport system fused ATPase/permease subunit